MRFEIISGVEAPCLNLYPCLTKYGYTVEEKWEVFYEGTECEFKIWRGSEFVEINSIEELIELRKDVRPINQSNHFNELIVSEGCITIYDNYME